MLWCYGPRWIAVVALVFAYIFPLFPFSETLPPFLILLVFAVTLPISGVAAIVLGIAFALILGNKELLFIARNRIHETIILLFIALGLLEFFGSLFYESSAFSFIELGLGAIGLFLLLQSLFMQEVESQVAVETAIHPRFAAGLATFLLVQFTAVIAFVPMNLFYKTAFVLLASTVLIDLILQYLERKRDPRSLFIPFALFFIISIFILMSNTWHP